ncbi:MAG: DNA polymerase sliding clamp [Crenarchaeota archaeon]|nr:DNA polymerase sliding clamp [Thermoproteota archaeon]
MSMRAVYPAATKFKYIVETLAKAIDEIPFIATPEGITVKSLSPDKTTMIVLNMPASSFEEYEVSQDKVTFVVGADELRKAAKRGTRNDVLEIRVDLDARKLILVFRDKKTNISRSFDVPLRESIVEELAEPQVELTVTAQLIADDFKLIVRDAKLVSDEIEFKAYEDRIEAITSSMQKQYKCIMDTSGGLISLEVRGKTPVTAKYAVDLLQAGMKAAQAAQTVTMEYGEALPMRLVFSLPAGSTLVYWISPRI